MWQIFLFPKVLRITVIFSLINQTICILIRVQNWQIVTFSKTVMNFLIENFYRNFQPHTKIRKIETFVINQFFFPIINHEIEIHYFSSKLVNWFASLRENSHGTENFLKISDFWFFRGSFKRKLCYVGWKGQIRCWWPVIKSLHLSFVRFLVVLNSEKFFSFKHPLDMTDESEKNMLKRSSWKMKFLQNITFIS